MGLEGPYVAGLLGGVHPGLMVGAVLTGPASPRASGSRSRWSAPSPASSAWLGILGEGDLESRPSPPYDVYQIGRQVILRREIDPRALVSRGSVLAVAWRGLEWAPPHLTPHAIPFTWERRLPRSGPERCRRSGSRSRCSIPSASRASSRTRCGSSPQARYEVLRSQINPHFLFNTLNSINSSIRTNSDRAREMIRKLSAILRRALEPHEDIVPLRDELDFIDAYLDIETVRFGRDMLRVVKRSIPRSSECRCQSDAPPAAG